MNLLHITILSVTTTLLLALHAHAQPIGAEEAIVEIIKQKLVKFPDDTDQQQQQLQRQPNRTESDEAKRILAQIDKVNQALGYVKKQADMPRVPPMLDSSQYLFPKPAYHPFHEHNHQFAGAHGETLLVPSIRSYRGSSSSHIGNAFNFNVPPRQYTNSPQHVSADTKIIQDDRVRVDHRVYNVPPKRGGVPSDWSAGAAAIEEELSVPDSELSIADNYNVPPKRTDASDWSAGAPIDVLPVPNLQLGIRDYYNVPPPKQGQSVKPILEATTIATNAGTEKRDSLNAAQATPPFVASRPFDLFFRPHQVQVPAPQTPAERAQLPTHFVLPVRLYAGNKSTYMEKFNPQEYTVKGYKIVGDVDHFYGKAKQALNGKSKSTAKYHLFFLPRELLLNEQSGKGAQKTPVVESVSLASSAQLPTSSAVTPSTTHDTASREEKLANRPFRVQTTATTSTSNKNGVVSNTTSTTQVVRKRIVPKPLRPKDQTITSVATQPHADGAGSALSATSVQIATAPLPMHTQERPTQALPPSLPPQHTQPQPQPQPKPQPLASTNTNTNASPNASPNSTPNVNNNGNTNKLSNNFGFWPLPSLRPSNDNNNALQSNGNSQANDTNGIKNAFQNIFRLPFRPERPVVSQIFGGGLIAAPTATLSPTPAPVVSTNLQSVPLQVPQKTFFTGILQPEIQPAAVPPPQPIYQSLNNHQDHDYKWDDESNASDIDSNSAAEEDSGAVNGGEEKQIFGHFQHNRDQHQATQQEAIKHGGIIIQRLKVRKGGIAIAGPGGVATAGSGGTAIVGPGGYALTHPRSLTIAGPGAKVIAIPANVDLKDALQRTNLKDQTFPREGRIVATGPTIYYAPPTALSMDTGTGTALAV